MKKPVQRQLKAAAKTVDEDVIDGPAVVEGDHVRDRILSPRAGAKAGWSRLTIYERAFRLGHLKCKERCVGAAAAREEEGRPGPLCGGAGL